MNASFAAPAASPDAPVALSTLHRGATGTVAGVVEDDGAALGDETGGTIVMRLIELGFVPGERFEIIAEARPGGDPIAVRIGGTCFALRRREAAAVMVTPVQP
jgi:ferrous iron transport protein A